MNAVTVGSAVSRLYDGYEDGYVEGFDLKLFLPSGRWIGSPLRSVVYPLNSEKAKKDR